MLRAVFLAIAFALLIAPTAHASWLNAAYKFQSWCERPAKSLSFGLSDAKRDLFLHDVERKLKQLKLERANAQVDFDDKLVSVTVNFRYPSPERHIVRRDVIDGIPRVTERIDFGWQIIIVAERGRLLTSDVDTISQYETF